MNTPDIDRLQKCRTKLIETAKARSTITYGQLAEYVGLANQGLGDYLMALYRESPDRDLTLVVVYAGTMYGRYRGEECKRPETAAECDEYDRERQKVYDSYQL